MSCTVRALDPASGSMFDTRGVLNEANPVRRLSTRQRPLARRYGGPIHRAAPRTQGGDEPPRGWSERTTINTGAAAPTLRRAIRRFKIPRFIPHTKPTPPDEFNNTGQELQSFSDQSDAIR
jgi:hypothetical protein